MPFGHEAVDEVGLKLVKFEVVTSDDEIIEVVDRKIDEGLSGIVPVSIEVEVGFIEDEGDDIVNKELELEDIGEDK